MRGTLVRAAWIGLLVARLGLSPAAAGGVALGAGESATSGRSDASSNGLTPLSDTIDPSVYRLGPGDALVLNLWGPISMTVPLEVGPEGMLFVPGIGSILVAGMALSDVRDRIEMLMRSQYHGVKMEVRLQRIRTFLVYRTGEVVHPGPALANGSSRPIDLLPDTLLTSAASRRNIVIRGRGGGEYVYDLDLFRLAGVRGASEALQGGDIIYVPPRTTNIGIWGGVARSGQYELGPHDSLSTLLRLGGGAVPAALRERSLFLRWKTPTVHESLWVSIDDIETGVYNPRLMDGDNLYVAFDPEYHELHQVTVVGHAKQGGDYPISLGRTRLSDAIRAAGGLREGADLSAIRLIRTRPSLVGRSVEFDRLSRLSREEMTESEYESFRTQLAALSPDFRVDWVRLQQGDPALDPVLADGDVIRVDRIVSSVRVDGQVRRPGVFEFRAGETWSYYLRLAGGWSDRAARTKVRVTRAVGGQTVLARNVGDMAPGDFVWVPERPDITAWEHLKDLITVAAQLATVVIAVRAL